MSPRWQRGGHEVTGEDSNFVGIQAEVTHFLQMEGAVRVRGTRRASDTVPHRQQMLLLPWVRPSTIKPSNSFALLDLHSSVPPYHHTPWGLSSWQSDQSTLTASSGYGDWSTWVHLNGLFYSHSAQLPLTPGFSAHPYDSFLAYETGPRLLPGSCPTPLWGRRPEEKEKFSRDENFVNCRLIGYFTFCISRMAALVGHLYA